MLTLQYLSFLTPATAASGLSIQLQTYDVPANVTLTLNVSGITGSETTFQLGQKVWTQMNTLLTQRSAIYSNVPPNNPNASKTPFLVFPDQNYSAIFNCTWTEHVVCLASQCNFSLTVSTNTIGCTTYVDCFPVLLDRATATSYQDTWGILWEDQYGNLLSGTQIDRAIIAASNKLTSHLKNNIVLSTYLYYEITDGATSLILPKTPVRDYFAPVLRISTTFDASQIIITYASAKSLLGLDRNRGILYYKFAQNLMYDPIEPFGTGNDVMLAYVAGYQKIPMVIKEYTARLSALINDNEFTEMSGEGSRFKFKGIDETLNSWAVFLEGYYLP